MNHLPATTLSALLDGELDPTGEREARAHLATCERCSDTLRRFGAVKEWARATRASAPPVGEWLTIRSRIQQEQVAAGRWRRSWLIAAVAAGIAILIAGPRLMNHDVAVERRTSADGADIGMLDSMTRAAIAAAMDTLHHASAAVDAAARSAPGDSVAQARRDRVERDRAEFSRMAERVGMPGGER